jgi:Photosynthesis system II assembly factor YCF48
VTNDKHDRDATVDRLLAGAMRRGSDDAAGGPVPPKLVFGGPSEGGCLDADTLAAWADNALSAGELAAAQTHAADCARCQAMLAAMVKTAPATPVTATFPRRLISLRWLVPVTAAATAVLLWTIVPLRDGPVIVRQVSQSAESIPQPPSPTQPASPAPATDAVVPPSAADVNERARREQQTPAEAKDVDLSRRSADLSRRSADLSRRSAAGAKAEGAEADKKNAASADLSRRGDARLEKMQASAPAAKTFSFGAPETVIVSSNPASRWRILQGGAVQRSADGGATWQTQDTGVSQTLSAGASPSPSVCWLVGPGGIVLLSTDGRSWMRVAFPEAVPLAAIRATDAENATVTTADGREFVTDDGGRTWTRKPE